MVPRQHSFPFWLLCAVFTAALSGFAQPAAPPSYEASNHPWRLEKISDYDWTHHFRVGAVAGFGIKSEFQMNGSFNAAARAPGIFDDGYVLPDSRGAANDASTGTGNWGVQNISQIGSTSVTMDQAASFSADNASASKDGSPYAGLDMAYGDSYWYWDNAKVGWECGFGLLPIHVSGAMPVSANRNVYTFSSGGAILPSAQPPAYQGGYDYRGDTSFIDLNPDSTNTDAVAGTANATLDAMLFTLRFGPTFYWDITPYIGLYAGGGPVAGLVSGDVSPGGQVTLADGSTAAFGASKASGTKLVYGGYVNATLVYHAVQNGDFYLGFQYMPMSGATFSGNGVTGHLKLGGQMYVMAGINWPF
ncbi:MAG: hypothetical protein KGR98_02800 [Verrucomicrobia bacterium]|nr:hypothetical protein [Verrucomicrobiota bacterium]MDE3098145.1 hypothetical protein [Verrucomicrobiota bacterium]